MYLCNEYNIYTYDKGGENREPDFSSALAFLKCMVNLFETSVSIIFNNVFNFMLR